MVKLTDSQRIVLSKAAAREDGAVVVPLRMTKAAASEDRIEAHWPEADAEDQIQAGHAGLA